MNDLLCGTFDVLRSKWGDHDLIQALGLGLLAEGLAAFEESRQPDLPAPIYG
jgi:hypothetical protein